MDDEKKIKKPSLEYYQTLLLNRLGILRRQVSSPQAKAEEELVELALSRINWGNYRKCLECGQDIDDELLMAQPTTLTCRSCSSAT